MKKTLLEIVREILNDLDSDDVNSISDTVESVQVANIVRSCYNELISNRNWPHLERLIQLSTSGDALKPTHLVLPENVHEMILFKYEKQKLTDKFIDLEEVKYKYPDEFLRYISNRLSSNPSVTTVNDFSGTKLLILNNCAPSYWTSFDDKYIVCDSYDSSIEVTLQQSKTQALAYISPEFQLTDNFVPDLPIDSFALLIEEAKSTAFVYLKQEINQKAEQKARRQSSWMSRKAWRTHGGVRYSNYGRKARR